jgi:hypothetical protein
MGASGEGGLNDAFEDSLGDFDEAMAGGAGGGAGGEEEIDILSPTGSGSDGAPSDGPLFEEAGEDGGGDSAENESVAQRAASGGAGESGESSSSSQQGGQSGAQSSAQSSSEQQDGQQSGAVGATGGGGAGAQQGNRDAGSLGTTGAEPASEEFDTVPDDVGDGRNDDIVLRQIRDAAMNERDPVLREKLWDEYRRIKGSR